MEKYWYSSEVRASHVEHSAEKCKWDKIMEGQGISLLCQITGNVA